MIDSFSEVVLASLIYVVVVGRWECGNREAISKSSGKGGKPAVGFPGFPAARHFHSSVGLRSALLLSSVYRPIGGSDTILSRSPGCEPGP